MDFKEYLKTGPSFEDLDLSRSGDRPREEIDWTSPEFDWASWG